MIILPLLLEICSRNLCQVLLTKSFKVFCNKILHQNNFDTIKLSCRDITQYISNAECDDFRFLEVQEESDF